MTRFKNVNGERVPFTAEEEAARDAEEAKAAQAKIDARGPSVKAEAYRRIIAIMPEWRQRNTLARGMQASMTYGADPALWPASEIAAANEANAAWATIQAIRDASDALEQMDPIPEDFAADKYWP